MTRIYDSGLPKPLPTLIREGAIAKLSPLLRANGGFAVAIVPFPYVINGTELRTDHDLDLLIDLVGAARCPAYAVACGDISGRRAGAAGNYLGDMELEVYCLTSHMRHVVEGRLAADAPAQLTDRLDPGVEVMREMARIYLTDQYPVVGGGSGFSAYGTKAKELRYEGERELVTMKEHTVWSVRFSITVELQADMLRGATALLTEIMTKMRIGAGEQPDPATPPLVEQLTPRT